MPRDLDREVESPYSDLAEEWANAGPNHTPLRENKPYRGAQESLPDPFNFPQGVFYGGFEREWPELGSLGPPRSLASRRRS